MFNRKKSPELIALDEVIDNVLSEMNGFTADSKEYGAASDNYVKLMKLRKELTSSTTISPDTLALIAANLAGIILILNHERVHVVASKALSFVGKLR